jgi:hypothetical protein
MAGFGWKSNQTSGPFLDQTNKYEVFKKCHTLLNVIRYLSFINDAHSKF